MAHGRSQCFSGALLPWFKEHGRRFPWRTTTDCYERVIAEFLLQRTNATMAARHYPLFVGKYPNWESIADASELDLQQAFKPIGLWKKRARALFDLSRVLVKSNFILPSTRDELESLPGISQYIASAVLLFCFEQKEPLLDSGMARVLNRVYGGRRLADLRYDSELQYLAWSVVQVDDPIATNWATLDLAATVCLRVNPKCWSCPLIGFCKTGTNSKGRPDD